MLVGAIAYALPQEQQFTALLPAFAGIVVATGGVVGMTREVTRKTWMKVNAVAAVLLLVYAVVRLWPDGAQMNKGITRFIADLDVLGLSVVFIYFSIKNRNKEKKG